MKNIPVIILHGWGLSRKSFFPLLECLSRSGFAAMAIDMPGFGDEPAPPEAWNLSEYAAFVKRYCSRHHLNRPLVIGHSFGGRVALKLNELYPGDLRAIILTGTPGFTPVPQERLFLYILVAKIGKVIFSVPPFSFIRDGVRRSYYYLVGARDFYRATGVMRDVFKRIVQEDLLPSMKAVRIPCLLLWGEHDTIVPVSVAQRMKERIPGAKLVVIPGRDHRVPYAAPEEFIRCAGEFISTL